MRSVLVTFIASSSVSTCHPEGGVAGGDAVGNECLDLVLGLFG